VRRIPLNTRPILLIATLFVLAGALSRASAPATDVNDTPALDRAPLLAYLRAHGKPPIDYVVSRFGNHDVVILGEMHEVPENLQLVSDLIAPLYHRAGVRCLATEFLRNRNTARANTIVTSPTYDEAAVIALYRDYAWMWGFREYMDILKAIWSLNHSLPAGAPRVRIVGLDSEIEEYEVLRAPEQQRPALREKLEGRDQYMADVLIRELHTHKGKVLLHTGYMHSLPRYRQPVVADGKFVREMEPRMGGILQRKLGKKVFQICLHQWHFSPEAVTGGEPSLRQPLGGLIEELLAANGNEPLGFDIEGSLFENLRDRQSYYFAHQPKVVFSDIAQGYVFLKPLKDLGRHCTWVKGFIDQTNFGNVRGIALQRGWIKEDEAKTPQELDAKIGNLLSSN